MRQSVTGRHLIAPRYAEVARARAFVVGMCSRAGLGGEPAARLALAVDEVCSNIIDHGDADAPIELVVSVEAERITLTVRDEADVFDPRSIPTADVSHGVNGGIGALGWHLVRDAVDHIDYRRTGGRNVLTLIIDVAPDRPGSS